MDDVKVHVLLKKEEIDTDKLNHDHVVVVLDVLLATSTITACLAAGAREVYPVLHEQEAIQLARDIAKNNPIVAGEMAGETIRNFEDPLPLSLRNKVKDRSVILSTTNGTVAIKKASRAKEVYIASLLNMQAIVNKLCQSNVNDTIIIVCSGSQNSFCMEDFYGAGSIVDALSKTMKPKSFSVTDSARNAQLFYEAYKNQALAILEQSKVGEQMLELGLEAELSYVSKLNALPIVPKWEEGKIII